MKLNSFIKKMALTSAAASLLLAAGLATAGYSNINNCGVPYVCVKSGSTYYWAIGTGVTGANAPSGASTSSGCNSSEGIYQGSNSIQFSMPSNLPTSKCPSGYTVYEGECASKGMVSETTPYNICYLS